MPTTRLLFLLALILVVDVGCGSAPTTPLCRDGGGERGPVLSRLSPGEMRVTGPPEPDAGNLAEYRSEGAEWRPATTSTSSAGRVLELRGLAPGTRYDYRLDAARDDALVGSFRTAPAAGDGPVRFTVLGDSGGGCAPQYAVAARLVDEAPDFVLHTGDAMYSPDPADLPVFFFRPFAATLRRAPFFLALGNHDVDTALLEAIELPTNEADGSERFYSFDWGNAHFVALDSNEPLHPGSVQHEWLRRDLERVTQPWRIVFFHHPPYSSSRASYAGIRDALEPLFAEHGVDLVFNGHDHNYERTYPMRDGQVVAREQDPRYERPDGTIYVVTGGGGRSLYASGASDFTARSESTYHVTTVEIDGPELRLRAVRADGSILDEISIHEPATRS